MAEIFGIATGALSVAALFNNCVDFRLKLDVAETRLGRWGEAIGVNDDVRFTSASPTDKAVKNAQAILEDIADCFEIAQKKSMRYAARADKQHLVVYSDSDMNPIFRRLHNRSRDIARQRQKGISIVKKVAWALYDGKSLENIVDRISTWVDELENLFPVKAAHQKFVEIEIEEVDDELSLKALKDAAHGIDPALEEAVKRKVAAIEGKNSAKNVTMEDKAKFHVGNVFSERVLQHKILVKDQTQNSVEMVSAKNESRMQIGNVYGGKGILDD
ncbi:hypothetical protein ACHAO4_010197 [Trichoderma viride]